MILKAKAKATGLVEFVADHTFRTVESLSSWMCPKGWKILKKKLLNCMHTQHTL